MGDTITSHDLSLLPSRKRVHTAPVPQPPQHSSPRLGARYESARFTQAQRGLWVNADGMSANALNDTGTRTRLRNRSRYEDQNNGYMSGLIGDRANETVGTGPRLQLTFPETAIDPDFQREVAVPEDAAHQVELKWQAWFEAVGGLDKLLTMDESETRDGEVFALLFANPALDPKAPQLDFRLYEADQCHTPDLAFTEPNAVDGIRYDRFGNPVEYHFLRQHPGDNGILNLSPLEYDKYRADRVIHWFKPKRPGQARGVPGLQSSLPLYGLTRAYTAATLATAQRQASLGGTIENEHQLPFGDDEEDDAADGQFQPGEVVQIGVTEFWSLPAGVTAKPFDATQPTTRYGEFKNEIITEAGRPINASRLISTGSAAGLNYASGRLEQQWWQRAIRLRRARFVLLVLNRLFRAWLKEAALIPGFLPVVPPLSEWRWTWRWPGFVSIDPVKDNTANQIALESGQTTFDRVCGENGEDWQEVMIQRAREREKALSLGLPDPFAAAASPAPARTPGAAPADREPNEEEPSDE
ncbi:MAG TPA: phage portal protein [Urbifossiella sp.]|nr:phage portal protein [Urbifossiella sp.]